MIDARLLAYRRGGIGRYIAGIVDWLPRVAPDLAFQRVINRESAPNGMEEVRVHTPPHFRFERATFGVECALRRPALIHSPDFIAPISVSSRRVITIHDLAFLRFPEYLTESARRYYGQVDRSIAAADRIIAVSDYTARQIRERTDVALERVVTIPNGVESCPPFIGNRDEAVALLKDKLAGDVSARILADRPVILMVGTIEPRKRQHLVLQALETTPLSSRSDGPIVILVGQRGWSCEPIVAEIERANAVRRAVWLENVDDCLLASLYQLATLLALPSIDEGFGLPLLEAMAAGLPVVAANRGALPEVAGGAALLVDNDDPSAWSEALDTLIDDGTRRQELRHAGQVRAAEFSWERTARETAALYREVLAL